MKTLIIIAEIYGGTAVLSCIALNVAMLCYARNLPMRERIFDFGWILKMSAVWPWTMIKGYRGMRKEGRL